MMGVDGLTFGNGRPARFGEWHAGGHPIKVIEAAGVAIVGEHRRVRDGRWRHRRVGRPVAAALAGPSSLIAQVLVAIHEDTMALVAGDKAGNRVEWYEVAVPTADAYYDDFLRRQR